MHVYIHTCFFLISFVHVPNFRLIFFDNEFWLSHKCLVLLVSQCHSFQIVNGIMREFNDDDVRESKPTRVWLYFCILIVVVAGATAFVVMFLLNKDDMIMTTTSPNPPNSVSNPYNVNVDNTIEDNDDDLIAPLMSIAPT